MVRKQHISSPPILQNHTPPQNPIMSQQPLQSSLPPLSWQECKQRGWNEIDVLLITGDAYVDHPSFGIAIICRVLEDQGYKVAILSQPRYDSPQDFAQYPTPRLFCGISAGNLDSVVANYSSSGRVRNSDSYSPDGNPWRGDNRSRSDRRRPDRASIIYTALAKSCYKNCPIVLGGIEASLRRFVHYDYKQDKLRASILTDAKADLIIFGMGERAIKEIAQRCEEGITLDGIRGTCQRFTEKELDEHLPTLAGERTNNREFLFLPSLAEIEKETGLFLDAEIAVDNHARAQSRQTVLQKQQSQWIIQHPAAKSLSESELDAVYALPFLRTSHKSQKNIPALQMIKDSVTIVRGCAGNCSFCAITRHQGAEIVSRSHRSIVKECKLIAEEENFHGTISDLGGPTANLYGTKCRIGGCNKRDCLFPKTCPNLEIDEERFLRLLKDVSSLKGVKHLFVSSGMRMELLLKTPRLMEKIIAEHTPGALKIAPEHTNDEVLTLMHKESHDLLVRFIERCREIAKKRKKPIYISPYIITSHPGSTLKHAKCLAEDLKKLDLKVRAFQDFTPTPGTISTAMYVTERHPQSKKSLFVPKNISERKAQRNIVEKEVLSREFDKKKSKVQVSEKFSRKPGKGKKGF
ncbi:conserved hypothetical protein [Desulfotalea psychrophila LSv54]|uniref:Radical SAM core domain-containing protein n=2 Tax=Desulfotalea psychrophila TaxID=84980 RepID=Q6APZ7_DESPS|nr:conserved hypothetical protein [Desulfotalea psychrophila LSv54]